MKESNKVLTKKDITYLALRSFFVVIMFNYQRMMAPGMTFMQIPALKKIHKNKEDLAAALTDNMEFINTHPNFCGFLCGLLLSLEEAKEDRSVIRGVKTALFAPLAGIGDAFFWFTLLPIMAGICGSFAMSGNILGPILFFVVYMLVFFLRIPLTHFGNNLGTKSLGKIGEHAAIISRCASIMGITIIGGLIATYVSLGVSIAIPLSEGFTLDLQTGVLDLIFPHLLPALYVGLLYYLLKKKNVSPVALITGTFVVVLLGAFIGIM